MHCIESTLPEDTFSLMIMSRPLSVAWFLGLAISLVQITLLTIFLYIQIAAYFNVTEAFVTARNNYSNLTEVEVTINLFSKYISILVIFFFQGDMLESLKMLCTDLTYENGKWKKFVNPEEIQKSRLSKYLTTERSQWYMIVIFPTALKLFEGFLAYLVCVLFTLLSNGVIDLYQNFASLLIISELDDEGFRMAVAGFFGEKCQRISAVVLNTTLVEEVPAKSTRDITKRLSLRKHSYILAIMVIVTIAMFNILVHWKMEHVITDPTILLNVYSMVVIAKITHCILNAL